MSFRFIHTADLHLDAPLSAIALRDPELAAEVGAATRQAFTRIVDLCLDEAVDFLLIAGDLWDGKHSSTKTPRFLKQQLLRLRDAGIAVYLIRGNHDAMSTRTGELDLPENAYLFPEKPATVEVDLRGHRVALHGLSFARAHAPDSFLPLYPAPVAGAFNIGLMHTSLGGSEGHDSYAPCTVNDLDAAGYDYWALGHIHKRAVHQGRATVVMPGNPQGRDIGESGDRSVTLVTVDDAGGVTLAARSVASLRFERCEIDLSAVAEWTQLLDFMEETLRETARTPRAEPHLVLRLRLTGTTPLAYRIQRDPDVLTDNARAFADHVQIWIDKLELTVDLPRGTAPAPDLPADLVDLVTRDLPQDEALMKQVTDFAKAFQSQLPEALRGRILGDTDEALREACRRYMAEGVPVLLDRLTVEGA